MPVRSGEVYENPRCRERVVIRTPSSETGGERLVMDVYVGQGGAVSGEHVHPESHERFTLVRGRLRVRIDGKDHILEETGQSVLIPPGARHRWFNAADGETYHICEFIHKADRFEQVVLRQLFGLAQDGKTNANGMPHLLQNAATTLEFQDVVRFTSPPWPVQRLLFGCLAPIAKMMGIHGFNPAYQDRRPAETAELEVLPSSVATLH